MREIDLNGYIDDEVWFGDEITPEGLHESLYGAENQHADDVHIRLNSCGGSCNAATRMFDDIRAYPGNVRITVSGTAASAATVLSMAADKLEMTPGSLWMIHDPSVAAWGNERDLLDSVNLLRACKESILNMYSRRCRWNRNDVAAMMTATTWMDAQTALSHGFIDAIADDAKTGFPQNAETPRASSREEAEKKVQAWLDRHAPQKSKLSRPAQDEGCLPGDDHTSTVFPVDEQAMMPADTGGTAPPALPEEIPAPKETPAAPDPPETSGAPEQSGTSGATDPPEATDIPEQPESTGTPIAQLQKRLGLIMPAKRSN